MTADDITKEFKRSGKLSNKAIDDLQRLLRSDDPYDAITAACDSKCLSLSSDIATLLTSSDSMVRWNAAAALFTRIRDKNYLGDCYSIATTDTDLMVKSVATVGLGELLQIGDKSDLEIRAAKHLYSILQDSSATDVRDAAYEGILAAMGVHPADRPSAAKAFSPDEFNQELVASFVDRYDL